MKGVSRFAQKLLGVRSQKSAVRSPGKDNSFSAQGAEAPALDERTIALGQIWAQVNAAINERDPEDWNLWHWVQDLYFDEGQLFAITISAGRLFRWPVQVDGDAVTVGEPNAVVVNFADSGELGSLGDGEQRVSRPPHPPSSLAQTTVRQTADGRWVGCSVLCTATVNKLGILDSRALFDSFVERFKGDGSEYINLLHLNSDESRIGTLRHIWREDKLLVGLYEFSQGDVIAEAAARRLADDEAGFWGGSIEFRHFGETQWVDVADGVRLPVTHDGELYGYSIARNQDCAAWYTGNLVMERTMTEKDRTIALELLGDEALVDELQKRLGEQNRALDGAVTRTASEVGSLGDGELGSLGDGEVGSLGDGEMGEQLPIAPPPYLPTAAAAEPTIYELEPEALEQLADAVVGHRSLAGRFEQLAFDFEQKVTAALARVDELTTELEQRTTTVDGRLAKLEQEDQVRYRQYDLEKPKQPVVKFGVRPRERKAQETPDVTQESEFARKARERRVKG